MIKWILALAFAATCLCLMTSTAFAGDGKLWHWNTQTAQQDPWNRMDSPWGIQMDYAWFDHGVGSYAGTQLLIQDRHMSSLRAGIYVFAGGVIYDMKDALVPMNKGWWGRYGGAGWSWKDLLRNVGGIVTAYGVNWLTTKRHNVKMFHHKKSIKAVYVPGLG
jgi:uncharacterized protein YfiM (DUF2279 family)